MSSTIEQLTRQLHDTFSNDQLDKTLEMASDDVVVKAHAFGMTFHKKDGFSGFMQSFKTAFPDIVIHHKNIITNGNRVAVEFIAEGTHKGPIQTPAGDIPPTGKHVTFTVAEFLEWENGKLKSIHNYQDAGSIMRQIGVM
jgi:steroid delta-isomerase-like uncharacterized protein